MNNYIYKFCAVFVVIGYSVLFFSGSVIAAQLITEISGDVLSKGKNDATDHELVSVASYYTGEETRILTLWRKKLLHHKMDMNEARRFLSKGEYFVKENLGFILVDSHIKDPLNGKVIWITYVNEDFSRLDNWSADFVWSEERKDVYIVMVNSWQHHIDLNVYNTSLDASVGDYPLNLNPAKRNEWPSPSHPISHKETIIKRCGLKRIDVIAEKTHLLIYGQRNHNECFPVAFRFDLTTGNWTEVTLQETPLEHVEQQKPPEKKMEGEEKSPEAEQ